MRKRRIICSGVVPLIYAAFIGSSFAQSETVGASRASVSELCKTTFAGAEYTTVWKTAIRANSVAGIVTHRERPIDGATVVLTDKKYERASEAVGTDLTGSFSFSLPDRPGLYHIIVCKPGFSPTRFKIRLIKHSRITKPALIELNAH
ncbi:MAG TPA: carboxypeptidase-like regulatory domain-containing protein, partial [Pyrinomonadaceae bacterium]|nr:carboxypeptidase-like regulatory domain-containing protein [Pyrinomonadaceae bacterium]